MMEFDIFPLNGYSHNPRSSQSMHDISLGFTVRKKLLVLAGAPCLGLVVLGIVAFVLFNTVKVNGKYYKQIVAGKDLVADILPPPEYVIESYLVALQMIGETKTSEIDESIRRSNALRTEYDMRHSYWSAALPIVS